jgi:dTDP-glucose 4,6-dehydratase
MKGTILVTGGAGFIGSNFIRLVLAQYPNVRIVCFDALTYAGNKDNLAGLSKKRLNFVKGDITDIRAVSRAFLKYKPNYVVNFAAESHVDRSIHGGANAFLHTNVYGTGVLLQELIRSPFVKKFLHVSTDEVYGSLPLGSKNKFTERTPLAPNSPYAASKAASDLVVRSFFKTYGAPVIITRCSNNYGPHQYPEKLIPFSIMRLMAGKPVTVYGDGLNVRDWVHVDDHNRALIAVLKKGRIGEIYNIGPDSEVNNLTLARRLIAHLKKDSSAITFVKDRPGHDRRYAIDASKIRKELGWKPKHSFDRSFKETVAWYISNPQWVEHIRPKRDL